ncbi:MAG: putative ATP-dependent endonuclease of the OLD family [Candidatus Nitrotoga sp. MKT]|nr:MAG: putative ATP-dependent endonuclease of the OLD family [Candidatus Nitrotoga sp. MKT]
MNIQITVKNYRSFNDANPLRIDICNGFIALVGPNNSGKSSCLKFFYELRNLWREFSGDTLVNFSNGSSIVTCPHYLAVEDPEEIFCDANNRAITIEIKIENSGIAMSGLSSINLVRVSCSRDNMTSWKFEFFHGKAQEILNILPNKNKVDLISNGVLRVDNEQFDFTDLTEVMSDLTNMLYIGPFRNAINEGAGTYFDLAIGSAFISTWNQWKTGGVKAHSRAIESITANIRQIFEYESLEINASVQLNTLATSINGKPYRLSELGAGLSQFIIVLGNAAIAKPSYILVDEPELHLHPSLQIDFLTSLASYARKGVIYATHSIGLARTTSEKIYSFQKKDGYSIVKNFDQTPSYAEFLGELSFSAFKEMGCDQILLVEGITDVKVIQQFLRKMKKDHRIVILPLGGNQLAKGGVEQELGELLRLSPHISAVVDSERKSHNAEPIQERTNFQITCNKLGIDALLTERRAIENYLTDTAIKSVFGKKYKALEYYESLRDSVLGWSKNDNWKIAGQMTLAEIEDTDLGKFLAKL